MFGRCCLGLGLAVVACAQPAPDAAEQARILAEIRAAARAYVKNLPDFICAQVTNREIALVVENTFAGVRESAGSRSNLNHLSVGRPQTSDNIEEQLTYFDGRENYQLLKVNGKRPKAGETRPPGVSSTGEFGSTLDAIFDPESKTEFEWKRWETLRGQTVHVFSYRVDKSHSTSQLDVPGTSIVVGYHGLVFADRDSKMVMRLTTEAEAPKDFPLQDVKHQLDYGLVAISGPRFLLPLHAGMQSQMSEEFLKYGRLGGRSRQVQIRNETDFREYRKYTAESELKTDTDKQ